MKTQQLIRFVGIVAFGAIALYAVGSLASSSRGDAGSGAGVADEPAVGAGDDVMAQIDLALGRPTEIEAGVIDPEKALELNALNVKPASRDAAGSTASAPPQP